jgi:methyl-accepting chemotaxis protein
MSIPAAEAAKYFTKTIAVILGTLPAIAEQSGDLDVEKQMIAYIAFLNAKERTGQERALMVPVFTADKIDPAQYRTFLGHVAAQQTYLSMFDGSASKDLVEFYRQKEAGEAFANVNAMRETVFTRASEGGFGIEPTQWFRTITAKIDSLREVEDMAAGQIKSSAAQRASHAFSMLLVETGFTVLVLLVTMILGFWIARSITRPLEMLKTTISDIQRSNDLTRHLAVESKDEIGQAADAFNQLIEGFRVSMNQVAQDAETVLRLSGQVAAASTQVAGSSQIQSDAASSMAAAVDEMTVSIDQISDHAREAQAISGNSNTLSEGGSDVILSVVQEMKRIAENVHQSSSIIGELGQHTNQIQSVVQVIKDIADQTNLLALNAAIEAARAGEQGRGFAVVADEVRKLAEKTASSTGEIAAMIGKIQAGAQHAVASMDVGVTCVNQGVALASQAGEAIHQIQQGSQQVSVAITDISSAIQEQSVASNEIAQHVEKVAQMSDENAAAIHNSSAVAVELQSLAVNLKNTVTQFRI